MNFHIIDRYRDGFVTVDFCKVCKREGQELIAAECPVQSKSEFGEKFISGLPDRH